MTTTEHPAVAGLLRHCAAGAVSYVNLFRKDGAWHASVRMRGSDGWLCGRGPDVETALAVALHGQVTPAPEEEDVFS